jgi:hypothetical protein
LPDVGFLNPVQPSINQSDNLRKTAMFARQMVATAALFVIHLSLFCIHFLPCKDQLLMVGCGGQGCGGSHFCCSFIVGQCFLSYH